MAVDRWTEDQTKRALYLYFQLPFGQLHSGNPEIIALANAVGRTPSSIAMKLANFASLDPKITESGRKGLSGASALDRQIWNEFNADWTKLVLDAARIETPSSPVDGSFKQPEVAFTHEPYVGPSTVLATVEQRVGQTFFRRAVLANFDQQCCLTGIAEPQLLNASHIMPWGSDVTNRHNPRNGLCLSATFDRAFDRGLMAVDVDGAVRFAAKLLNSPSNSTQSYFAAYEGKALREASRFDPDPAFLRWHYENRFDGQSANG